MEEFEYVVWDKIDNVIHRGPWSEQRCIAWIEECKQAFPNPIGVDEVWDVRRRAVGQWEKYNG